MFGTNEKKNNTIQEITEYLPTYELNICEPNLYFKSDK